MKLLKRIHHFMNQPVDGWLMALVVAACGGAGLLFLVYLLAEFFANVVGGIPR